MKNINVYYGRIINWLAYLLKRHMKPVKVTGLKSNILEIV